MRTTLFLPLKSFSDTALPAASFNVKEGAREPTVRSFLGGIGRTIAKLCLKEQNNRRIYGGPARGTPESGHNRRGRRRPLVVEGVLFGLLPGRYRAHRARCRRCALREWAGSKGRETPAGFIHEIAHALPTRRREGNHLLSGVVQGADRENHHRASRVVRESVHVARRHQTRSGRDRRAVPESGGVADVEIVRFYAGSLKQAGIPNPQIRRAADVGSQELTGTSPTLNVSLLILDDPSVSGVDSVSIIVEYPPPKDQ